MAAAIYVKPCGRADYSGIHAAMREFTDRRDSQTPDEIWQVEHPAVFTLGQAGRESHILAPGDIPVIRTDRGGQVTYHGPGQVVLYPLLDLRRHQLGPRRLVTLLETTVVDWLASLGIEAAPRADAPGVYVGEAKIAALGLRIRRGCSYHGLAVNIAMDLEPFSRINPCGYAGMAVTDLASLGVNITIQAAFDGLTTTLLQGLKRD